MSNDNAMLKAVSRHLPLLRGPLLVNTIIALVLSVLCCRGVIFAVELAFICVSLLASLFDVGRYCLRGRSSSRTSTAAVGDGDFRGSVPVMAVDAFLSVAFLPVWIVGLIVSSQFSWEYDLTTAMVATFCAFISWSFHLTIFCVEAYIWMKFGRRRHVTGRCPNCDHDLGTTTSSSSTGGARALFGYYYASAKAITGQQSQRRLEDDENEHGQDEEQQTTTAPTPPAAGGGGGSDRLVEGGGGGGGSSANEYDEGETDRLILEDDERKS